MRLVKSRTLMHRWSEQCVSRSVMHLWPEVEGRLPVLICQRPLLVDVIEHLPRGVSHLPYVQRLI